MSPITCYNDTRDVYLADQYYVKEYDNEEYSSEEYYDEDEYEVYLNTRSGPYFRNAVSKNKRAPARFQKPPQTTNVEDLEMEEPTPEPVSEPIRIEKALKTPRRRLLPAPIEQLTEFNVSTYLQNLPCGLSVGQAAHATLNIVQD